MQAESIALFCTENGSDKTYQVHLKPLDGGWTLTAFNGRRGSALKERPKIVLPVEYAQAKKEYDRLVSSKVKDGYRADESCSAYQSMSGTEEFSGLRPMLLTPVEESEVARLIDSPDWVLQEKADGERRMLTVNDGKARGINRRGLFVPLPESLVAKAQAVVSGTDIDGEIIGERFIAFDLLRMAGRDLTGLPYADRLSLLEKLGAESGIEVSVTVTGRSAKAAFLASCRAKLAEGVVFKNLDGRYTPGVTDTQLKFKFVADASVVVDSITPGKRSVGFIVYDADGAAVPIGKVTIPANHEVPSVGTIISVRYLYWMGSGGALFQPVYQGCRTDQLPAECTLSQLKPKGAQLEPKSQLELV